MFQYVLMNITYKQELVFYLWKTKSFLQSHKASIFGRPNHSYKAIKPNT
jgi:hypothetical protein